MRSHVTDMSASLTKPVLHVYPINLMVVLRNASLHQIVGKGSPLRVAIFLPTSMRLLPRYIHIACTLYSIYQVYSITLKQLMGQKSQILTTSLFIPSVLGCKEK